ncbi:MAG TPA: serine/threonine-protein kinase [Kofleriaceae bacterium]|nr:serine/threonine-protein kinase [Kofleriaceae bacterium]
MPDQRNPSGRRPPVLPLPPPPPEDDAAPRARQGRHGHGHGHGLATATTASNAVVREVAKDITTEIPRLPEVGYHETNEVRIDPRSLSPDRGSLTVARAVAPPRREPTARGAHPPPPPVAHVRPAPVRPAPPEPDRSMLQTPVPPPRRSGGSPRHGTIQQSTLVGGRYQLVSRIGQGGMGKVYKVTHKDLARTFALKIISNQVAETDEARELFYREARFASAMSHPGITGVVDFGEDEKVGMYMVMELVEGEPLHRILFREKRLSIRKACEIVLQVAEALHYIHKQNVVHCDIKTENILISEEEHDGKRTKMVAKLLDFGLARSLTASRASTSLSGTPHYVAPERIRGEPASPASDVYGVGILLYELITGAVPWDGPVQKILSGHLDEIARPPSQIIEGGIDPALERLIFHALAKRPAERHKDMAAFIYELRTVMDMLGFGRRGKQGPSKRVVIEQRSENTRDALGRIAFDGCRLPLALLSAHGVIVAANPAFAKFVMGVGGGVEGLPVRQTPLANAWSTCDQDLARTLAGHPIRRILEIDVSPVEVRRLLLWLDAISNEHVLLGVQPLEL